MTPTVRCQQIRRVILEQSKRAHVGHIGSGLSIVELLVATFDGFLRSPFSESPNRDAFVLSKGHAALAYYALLHSYGQLDDSLLNTFCADGTVLGVHPERELAGVEFSTGSLGHGLSYACGLAYAAVIAAQSRRVAVILSDAECNEGSVWEAALFAAHHKLSNVTAIIDYNRQQALGNAAEILTLEPLLDKWNAFGWETISVDGHDLEALIKALSATALSKPRMIIANTIFGKGISFMERQLRWHYMPLSESEYATALSEIGEKR